jgi:hypothetical protein
MWVMDCITWIIQRQLRGYKGEDKLYPEVRDQKKDECYCSGLRLALSKGPNGVGASPLNWTRKHIQFPKRCVSYLEYRMTETIRKTSTSERSKNIWHNPI